MKNIKQRFRLFRVVIIILVGFCIYPNLGHVNNTTNTSIYTLDQKISGLKASGTYENITIDTLSWNNWTWAENQYGVLV